VPCGHHEEKWLLRENHQIVIFIKPVRYLEQRAIPRKETNQGILSSNINIPPKRYKYHTIP
jgi:hypothetical protein